MSVAIQIPRSLRRYSHCADDLRCEASTVRQALRELERDHPSVYSSVCDETGAVRRHINLFINEALVPVREPQGLDAPLKSGDVLTIFTAVSGG